LGDVPFTWTTRDEAVHIAVPDARPFGGRISAEAVIPVSPGKPITGTATLTAIDAAQVALVVPGGRLALTGKVSGKVDVTVPPDVSALEATGDLTAPDLTVQGLPAEKVRLSVHARGWAVGYEVTGESLGGTIRLKGSIPLNAAPGERRSESELQAVGFELDRLWKARGIAGATARLNGRGALDTNLRWDFDGPAAGLYAH
jgi:translocation and assembly module TamB